MTSQKRWPRPRHDSRPTSARSPQPVERCVCQCLHTKDWMQKNFSNVYLKFYFLRELTIFLAWFSALPWKCTTLSDKFYILNVGETTTNNGKIVDRQKPNKKKPKLFIEWMETEENGNQNTHTKNDRSNERTKTSRVIIFFLFCQKLCSVEWKVFGMKRMHTTHDTRHTCAQWL